MLEFLRRSRLFGLLVGNLFLLLYTVVGLSAASKSADLVLVNGKFITVDAQFRIADAVAINAVIPGAVWSAPADTGSVDKGTVRSLVRHRLGRNASFNEIDFAKSIAPKFDPTRARPHSASFRYFWELLEARARYR